MTRLFILWLLLPSLAMAQDYLKQFPLQRKTTYFEFHYRRHPELIADIARFADGFVKIANRDFFKADFDYPIRVLVLEDRTTFQDFLRREFRIKDPPGFGIYIPPQLNALMTNVAQSLGAP